MTESEKMGGHPLADLTGSDDAMLDDWSVPDAAGIRHFTGQAPTSSDPIDSHTYLPPRIVPCKVIEEGVPYLRIVCACGWETDPLPGITLSDAAVLYSDHLMGVIDDGR